MVLADWLETHQDKLVASAVQKLSDRDTLRQQAASPVRCFFDSLRKAVAEKDSTHLETVLRGWVNTSRIPLSTEPEGLLPVLGVFKRAIWDEFRIDPPPDAVLESVIELDAMIGHAVEFEK